MVELDYSKDEVQFFHPWVIRVFNEAIEELALGNTLYIQHHLELPNGSIPDICLIRRTDDKILMPIEVKRTAADVRTSGRRQAQDYAVHLEGRAVDGYYCSTNLELFELFRATTGMRHDKIHLNNSQCGEFAAGTASVIRNALVAAKEIVQIVVENSGVLEDTLSAMVREVSGRDDSISVHHLMSGMAYEYIRGAFSTSPNLKHRLSDLGLLPLKNYRNSIDILKSALNRIDFNQLFVLGAPSGSYAIPSIEAQDQAFLTGAESRFEDFSGLSEDLALALDPGFVETDHELARSLTHLVSILHPDRSRKSIWDPGAGTGRLLAAAFRHIPGTELKDLFATEVLHPLREALTLNLALLNPRSLSPENSPRIEINDVCSLSRHDCDDVGLVVMNPPFVAHVRSVERQQRFEEAISGLRSGSSRTSNGQAGLESLFLELIVNLVPPGTVIATVFPHQALSRRSKAFRDLRKFLIEDFGLTAVFDYPHKSLFGSVTKQTCVLVGVTGERVDSTYFLQTDYELSRLGTQDFAQIFTNPDGRIKWSSISVDQLDSALEDGWRLFLPGAIEHELETSDLPNTATIRDQGFNVRRGKFGNSGSSKTFLKDSSEAKSQFPYIPEEWWKPGINNTAEGLRRLDGLNIRGRCFVPPDSARTPGTRENQVAMRFVTSVYPLQATQKSTARQAGRVKDSTTRIQDLLNDSKVEEGPLTLIPRASRQAMDIFHVVDSIIPSTNFLCVKTGNEETQELFTSWMLSVFAQVQLEALGSSENGMRKIELSTILEIKVPSFDSLAPDEKRTLRTGGMKEDCLNASSLTIRDLDKQWSMALFGEEWEEYLHASFKKLVALVNERRP